MGRKEIKLSKNQLKDFYEKQKLSIRKLAKIYTCGATTIQRRLHKYDIQVHPSMSVRIDIPENRLRFLYEGRRKSSSQLAKLYSCSFKTILNRLKEYNIKVRDISEAHIKYPKRDFNGDLTEKSYLIGFRIGDLHIRRYEKNGKVISADKNILSQIQNKLMDKGISSTLNLDRPKGSKINLPIEERYSNKEYKTRHDFWRLAVYKKKDLLKLFNRITPYLRHPRMKRGLLKARKNIYWRNQAFGNLRMN